MTQTEAETPKPAELPPVVVKKYANRRLYNTETSSYITLENLADMVRHGRDFVVYDAKSADDITRSVLTQIIVEEENKGRALLPNSFLRHLIGLYGDSLQSLVPKYLEESMASFARQQEQMRVAMQQTVQQTVGNFFPFNVEEVGRQNMAMVERAMSLFTPFYRPGNEGAAPGSANGASPQATLPEATAAEATLQEEIAALRHEVETLRARLGQTKPPRPTE